MFDLLNNKLNDERATSSLVPQKYEVMHQALLRKYSLTHLVPTRTKYDTYDTKYIVGCIYIKKKYVEIIVFENGTQQWI